MLALALAIHEATICPGCGQDLRYSMDPDLEDYWTTVQPQRCHACTALGRASDKVNDEKREHVHALKIEPGLRSGWEEHLAEVQAGRAAKASDEG